MGSWRGNTEMVRQLFDKAPLHDACRAGDTERVRQLLDEGAAVDEKDEYGCTALMLASLGVIMGCHTEVVQLLLGKGAAVDVKDKDGRIALMVGIVRSSGARGVGGSGRL